MLQEAALDLFAQWGYASVTVEEIARVSGVSRPTFFAYFPAKADVFWVELDEALDAVVAAAAVGGDGTRAWIDGVLAAGVSTFGPDAVPWALTQSALLGDTDVIAVSAAPRVARLADAIAVGCVGALGAFRAQVRGAAVAGAVAVAVRAWAGAGIGRGALAPYVDAALDEVVR